MHRAFLLSGVVVLLVVSVCLGERPRFPYQAKLTLEGMVKAHDHVVIGRFIKARKEGRVQVGTLACDEVIRGDHKKGDEVELKGNLMTWRSLDGVVDGTVVVFFNEAGGLRPDPNKGKSAGRRATVEKALREAAKEAEEKPTGRVMALGMHLSEEPVFKRGMIGIKWELKNFSTVSWSVLVDRRVSRDLIAQHRGISVRVWELPEREPKDDGEDAGEKAKPGADNIEKPAEKPALKAPLKTEDYLYMSSRPWHTKAVMTTARNNTRPARHVAGAVVRVPSGRTVGGQISFRPVDRTRTNFAVHINGHVDGDRTVQLHPGKRYAVMVTFDDDYHYYTGNGAKIATRDMYWGRLESNIVVLDIPEKKGAE